MDICIFGLKSGVHSALNVYLLSRDCNCIVDMHFTLTLGFWNVAYLENLIYSYNADSCLMPDSISIWAHWRDNKEQADFTMG